MVLTETKPQCVWRAPMMHIPTQSDATIWYVLMARLSWKHKSNSVSLQQEHIKSKASTWVLRLSKYTLMCSYFSWFGMLFEGPLALIYYALIRMEQMVSLFRQFTVSGVGNPSAMTGNSWQHGHHPYGNHCTLHQ